MKNYRYPVIIDVDTGIDDAVALAFAGVSKKIDLKLVSCVFGNIDLKHVEKNTLAVLDLINRKDVKVVAGASKPLKIENRSYCVHGKNGLGDYVRKNKLKISNQDFREAYHEVVAENALTYIIACGPLTNCLAYLEKYPEDNEKVVFILSTGLLDNNIPRPYVNFNIYVDPDAIAKFMKIAKNVIVCPSDMGHRSYIKQEDFYKSRKYGEVGEVFADIFPMHLDGAVDNGAALHDACAVALLIKPSLFKFRKAYADIVYDKIIKERYMCIDFHKPSNNKIVVNEININGFQKLYYDILKQSKSQIKKRK